LISAAFGFRSSHFPVDNQLHLRSN
jgi:hypothetical protein